MKSRILTVLFFFCISCQFKVADDPYSLNYPIAADPDSLNPITSMDSSQQLVNRYVYERLVKIDKTTAKPLPLLATGWDVSADHLIYTFHLRHDVKWHDGAAFTADDVLYSYERVQDPNVDAAPARVDFRTIEKFEKLDDYTVRFTFKEPDYKAVIFVGMMPIVPKHVFDNGLNFNSHPAGRAPIGTGPYLFARWDTGRNIMLERNDAYWGEIPDIKKITFRIIPDTDVIFQTLKKGELDISAMRPIQWVRQADTENFNKRFNKYEYYLSLCYAIVWNQQKPYFADRHVRIALTHLVNRAGISEKIYFGKVKVLSTCFDINSDEYDNSIEPYPYDPKKAVELLASAGWVDHDGDGILDRDGVAFKFTFLHPGGDNATARIANIVREDFLKAGIVMEVEQQEWATFLKQVQERHFDAVNMGFSLPINSDPYQLWHSSQTKEGSNYGGFRNEEVDRLLIEARREFDDTKRNAIYHRIQKIIHEEEPYTFMFAPKSLVAVSKRLENVNAYRRGVDMLEWKVKK